MKDWWTKAAPVDAAGWQTFAKLPNYLVREGTWPGVFVDKTPTAAMLEFDELPLWTSKTKLARRADGKTPLPGQIGAPPTLKLSLEKEVFVIRSAATLIEQPEHYLLARWWVNGKLAAAKLDDAREKFGRGLEPLIKGTRKMGVGFGLPASLGPLKAGDRVTLQVLYTPSRYQRITKNRWPDKLARAMMDLLPDMVSLPQLSNKLEFVVTEAMLAGGQPEERKKTEPALGNVEEE